MLPLHPGKFAYSLINRIMNASSRRLQGALEKTRTGVIVILVAIDHGNQQIKLSNGRSFTSGFAESETRPPFGEEYLKYNGRYYSLSGKRIPFMRNKVTDDRFYILTLFAIAYALTDARVQQQPSDPLPVKLLVGLPPAHFGVQYERFEEYFLRNKAVEFEFRGTPYSFYISEVTAYHQAFAAAMPIYGSISSLPRVVVVDIGGFTADYLVLRNGQADLSLCDSLEHGVIALYNQIISKVSSAMDILLDEADIDRIIRGNKGGFSDDIARVVEETTHIFLADLFGKLRERSIDLRTGNTVFVGGGSMLLRKQIEASERVTAPVFVNELAANARGYELLYRASERQG